MHRSRLNGKGNDQAKKMMESMRKRIAEARKNSGDQRGRPIRGQIRARLSNKLRSARNQGGGKADSKAKVSARKRAGKAGSKKADGKAKASTNKRGKKADSKAKAATKAVK